MLVPGSALPRSRRVAIRASTALDRLGLAEPAFRLYERWQTRRWARRGLETGDDGLPVPPTRLRVKVFGTGDARSFLESGRAQAATLREFLGTALDGSGRLLDFGVGCGRVARYWHGLELKVHGCDYNAELVDWVAANLHFVQLEPPLDYPAGYFDVVYTISVFTHLPEGLQVPWMQELARVVAPGGTLLVTTHGERLAGHMLAHERARFEAGELVVRNARAGGSNLCTVYHPPSWVRAHLLDDFDELAWRPAGMGGGQDVWLLRRESEGVTPQRGRTTR